MESNKTPLLSIIDNAIISLESQMKDYPLRFLNSDSNKGLSEFSFQLLLYTTLLNQENKGIMITMEKVMEGKTRCDIFIKDEDDSVIIELKYIRLSYLRAVRTKYTKEPRAYQLLLENTYDTIKNNTKEELLKLYKWSEYLVSTKGIESKEDKYETIKNVLDKAEIQANTYAKQYQNQDFRSKPSYYIVIIGIGFRIIRGELYLYKRK